MQTLIVKIFLNLFQKEQTCNDYLNEFINKQAKKIKNGQCTIYYNQIKIKLKYVT